MKQRIPLTKYNIEVLIRDHGMSEEELTLDYWVKYIMTHEEEMNKVFKNSSPKDIQIKIQRRTSKLLKENLRVKLGLPKLAGSPIRQRAYSKAIKKTKLQMGNQNVKLNK